MWARIINAALGAWLMAAPAVLGYDGTTAADHDRVVGPLLATFACVAIWETTRMLRRVNLVLGLWMLAAPWLLGFPKDAAINAVAVGVAVVCLSLVRGTMKHRFGGGWSVLWRGGEGASPA